MRLNFQISVSFWWFHFNNEQRIQLCFRLKTCPPRLTLSLSASPSSGDLVSSLETPKWKPKRKKINFRNYLPISILIWFAFQILEFARCIIMNVKDCDLASMTEESLNSKERIQFFFKSVSIVSILAKYKWNVEF